MEIRALPRTTVCRDASEAKYVRHEGLKGLAIRGKVPRKVDVGESLGYYPGVSKRFHGPQMHQTLIIMIIWGGLIAHQDDLGEHSGLKEENQWSQENKQKIKKMKRPPPPKVSVAFGRERISSQDGLRKTRGGFLSCNSSLWRTRKQQNRSGLKTEERIKTPHLPVLTKTTSKEPIGEGCGCVRALTSRCFGEVLPSVHHLWTAQFPSTTATPRIFVRHGPWKQNQARAHTSSPFLWLFNKKPTFQGMYICFVSFELGACFRHFYDKNRDVTGCFVFRKKKKEKKSVMKSRDL